MTLFPIEHAHRLGSPAEAEALFGALGDKVVGVRGCATAEPAGFDRLVAAYDTGRDRTLSFEGGTLALDALEALARASYGYLDVRTATSTLRSWPGRDHWVYDDAGERELRTPSLDDALAHVRGLTRDPRLVRGHITGAGDDGRAPLARFLAACETRAHITYALALSGARALVEGFPDTSADWQASGVLVDFPDGRIHGFLTTPKTDEKHRRAWHARIDKALRRAHLT